MLDADATQMSRVDGGHIDLDREFLSISAKVD